MRLRLRLRGTSAASSVLNPQAGAAGVLVPQAGAAGVLVPQAGAAGVLVPQAGAAGVLFPRAGNTDDSSLTRFPGAQRHLIPHADSPRSGISSLTLLPDPKRRSVLHATDGITVRPSARDIGPRRDHCRG